jgi:hypothetical protein
VVIRPRVHVSIEHVPDSWLELAINVSSLKVDYEILQGGEPVNQPGSRLSYCEQEEVLPSVSEDISEVVYAV